MISTISTQIFTVRIATVADILGLTELHCASFQPQEHVPMMLGKEYVRSTYDWLVGSEMSYCLVAESKKEIIGFIAVCDGPYTRPMFMACLPEFIQSVFRSPSLLFQKKLWGRLLRHQHNSEVGRKISNLPGIAQITIGAVEKEWRGAGVFPALVDTTKSISKQRGSRAIRVGIYKTNRSSRKVFVKGGWVETPELETQDTVFYLYYLDPNIAIEIGRNSD